MTVTLNLTPEVEAGLLSQANGMALQEYLFFMVEGVALSAKQTAMSPEECAAAFEAWSASHRPTRTSGITL